MSDSAPANSVSGRGEGSMQSRSIGQAPLISTLRRLAQLSRRQKRMRQNGGGSGGGGVSGGEGSSGG